MATRVVVVGAGFGGLTAVQRLKGAPVDITLIDERPDEPREISFYFEGGDFDGVLIPDHTPEMACAAPWHAGMAYALGYMRALLQQAERRP